MASSRRGFTLIELLVVVGIIATLVALLLPVLGRARQQARSAGCLGHLHQLSIAFQSYFQQNRGRPPFQPGNLDWNEQFWVALVRREMNGSNGAMLCPAAAEPTGVPQYDFGGWSIGSAHHAWIWYVSEVAAGTGMTWAWDGGSYGLNDWVLAWPQDIELPPSQPRDAFIKWPPKQSDTIPLVADAVYAEGMPHHTHRPPPNLIAPIPPRPPWPSDPGAGGMWIFSIARHGRATNVLFLDGHAATVPLADLWRLKWNEKFEPTQITLPAE